MIPFPRMLEYGNTAGAASKLTKVQTGGNATFVLYSTGELYNRGQYINGNLGNSTVNITGDWRVANTAVQDMWYNSESLSCLVLKSDGTWFCTGDRKYLTAVSAVQQVPYDCTVLMQSISTSGSSVHKIVYTGNDFFCLLNDGRIISSGVNTASLHGTGSAVSITAPVLNSAYNSLGSYIDIGVTGNTFYALRNDGTLYGSGSSGVGQLIGTKSSTVPKLLSTDVLLMGVCNNGIVISKVDGVYVLGSQYNGQLGDGVIGTNTAAVGRTSFTKILEPINIDSIYFGTGSYLTVLRDSSLQYYSTGSVNKGSVNSASTSGTFSAALNVPPDGIWSIGSNNSYIIGKDAKLYGTGIQLAGYDPLPGYSTSQFTFVELSMQGVNV